jgi:hypothetical protein
MSDKHEQMSEQGIAFGDLIEELQRLFFDMPAPESDNLAWSHVESAKKINADLKELIAFLSK